jgi:hypothetical protein
MTDLELLNAELERQNRELDACFEQMRSLDPALELAVSPEWLEAMAAEPEGFASVSPWALRG